MFCCDKTAPFFAREDMPSLARAKAAGVKLPNASWVIADIPYFWNHFEIHIENPGGQVVDKEWWPLVDYRGLNRERLREHWLLCKAILDGEKPLQHLKELNLPPGKPVEKPDYYPPIKKVRSDQ